MKAQTIMVKLLLNCRFSKQNKGFVISLDTFFAILLLLGVISYLGIGMQPTEQPAIAMTIQTNAKQILDDAITAMDNNGFIGKVLVDDSGELTTAQAQKIYERLKQLLPSNMDLNIKITRFEPVDDLGSAASASTCRGSFEFDKCFKTNPETVSVGIMPPQNNEVFYGNQLFMKRQPYIKGIAPNTCILESQLAGKKTIQNTSKALFDSEPIVTTKVQVKNNANAQFTGNKMQCYDPATHLDDQTAIITLSEKSGTRPPISAMLVTDKSTSMNQYDLKYYSMPANTLDNGTCNYTTCTLGSSISNCSNYQNWIELGTITITQSLLDRLPLANSTLDIYPNSYTSSTCGNVPRLKIVAPNATVYPNNDGTNGTLSIRKDQMTGKLGDWKIYGWSNIIITKNIYTRLAFGSYINISSGTMSGIGTATGETSSCANYDNFQLIGTFTASDPLINSVYGQFSYTGYNGKCNYAAVKVKDPNGGWFSTVTSSCTKPNASCSSSKATNLQGTYEIWAWSDVNMPYTSRYYFYIDVPYTLSSKTISDGNCGGVTCTATTVPSNCGSPTAWQTLGTINIQDDLLGIMAIGRYSGYAGNCSYARMRLLTPPTMTYYDFSTSGKPNWGPGSYTCYANSSGNCQTTPNLTSWPKLQKGNWDINVWADESTTFGPVDFNIQRIDAAKKASKTFLDNAQWKANDLFGLVSYSTTAVTNQALTTDKDLIKTAIDNLHPDGETALGNGIIEATDKLGGTAAKYMVVLTDGKANLPTNEASAAAFAIEAANTARANGITIYVIGFAALQQIQSNVVGLIPARTYESILKETAKDKNSSYCDDNKYCGKYYYAATGTELEDLYNLIAQEIGVTIPDTKITVNPVDGMELCKCSNVDCAGECAYYSANWTTSPIIFENVSLGAGYVNQYYRARLSCTGTYCEKNFVEFPPTGNYDAETTSEKGTYIEYGNNVYEWGKETSCDAKCDSDPANCLTTCGCDPLKCTKKTDFAFRDLGIYFTGGIIVSSKAQLDFEIKNNSTEAITPGNQSISFYKDSISAENHKNVESITSCPANGCVITLGNISWNGAQIAGVASVAFTSATISGLGYIKTVFSGINECALHNESNIYCLADSKVYYFKVEYSAWVK